MNHKKSMRIFWLSLGLLLVSGTIIIAIAQFRAYKAKKEQDAVQESARTQADNMEEASNTITEPTKDSLQYADHAIIDPSVQQTNGGTVVYLYEIKIKNGYLEVYYYQSERLFLYTGIPYHTLTADQRQDLQRGKYFRDEQELYGYLESCTS